MFYYFVEIYDTIILGLVTCDMLYFFESDPIFYFCENSQNRK